MKRTLLTAILLLSLVVSGCSGKTEKKTDEKRETVSEKVPFTVKDISCTCMRDGVSYTYHFPEIIAKGQEEEAWNAVVREKISEAEKGACLYDKVSWRQFQKDGLICVVEESGYTNRAERDFRIFRYDRKEERALTCEAFLLRCDMSYKEVEERLLCASAHMFDETVEEMAGIYGNDFEDFAYLRAQTLSETNIRAAADSVFMNNAGEIRAYGRIGTPAGSGLYTVEPPLTERTSINRGGMFDFIKAEIKNGTVTVTFNDTGMAKHYILENTISLDTPYKVQGLYGDYVDMTLGYMGNGGYAYLFLTDTSGRVSYCDLMYCLEAGGEFIACGPLFAPKGVTAYKKTADMYASDLMAETEKGEVSLSEAVLKAERAMPEILNGSVWRMKKGAYEIVFSDQEPYIIFKNAGRVFAAGDEMIYLGMTEKGITFFFRVETPEDDRYSGRLTLSCPRDEKDSVLTLTQIKGSYLPGLLEMPAEFMRIE